MKALATPEPTLDAALDRVWALLDDAVADRRAALHQLVVVTGGDTGPDARTMVVRGSDRSAATLRFHSDRRATKIAVIAAAPRVGLVGYDPVSAIQLRLHGTAQILTSGESVERSWAAISAFGQRAYMTLSPPGTILDAAGADLPTIPDSGRARDNFAVVDVTLDRIEWLHLARTGHRRAVHIRTLLGWKADWLVP